MELDATLLTKAHDQGMVYLTTEPFRSSQVHECKMSRTEKPDIIKFEAFGRTGKNLPRYNFYWDMKNKQRILKRDFERSGHGNEE